MAQPAKIHPQVEAALKRLDDLARRKPEMAEAVAFYRALIPALHEAQQAVPTFTFDPTLAQRKLESGRPLLVGEDLPLDTEATADLFLRLCRIVENSAATATPHRAAWSPFKRGHSNPTEQAREDNTAFLRAAAARQIRHAVLQNQLDLAGVWLATATGDEQRVELAAATLHLDPGLLRVLAQNSLKPALHAWAQGFNRVVDLDHWRRGRCPMCGNPPTLSEIQGKEGERRLRCARCGAGWYYPRLQCPFCHSQDYKTLGYIAVEGEEEKYRLQTCDACRGYLKVVVTYDPIPVELLSVEDLATLHLDWIANERGFARVPVQ
ncbi:MAG: formate dehydrogenase accessory protein FdhE [Chloroflexi bacterium]|nr:formate dehydrogenase accessory protein FdhE [Chloroflexota bacterium]MCI0577054.1 formate dehydrogenase accessory protein FdhE [Chloroflexota bacterium]MCI0643524.1 formate dehydrogenase accessory protein FdhE [Chloroflexota bacterium]MCI0728134.1 formate dehydrogenase accessory protein FdhE [Chloroflexota bacterium]